LGGGGGFRRERGGVWPFPRAGIGGMPHAPHAPGSAPGTDPETGRPCGRFARGGRASSERSSRRRPRAANGWPRSACSNHCSSRGDAEAIQNRDLLVFRAREKLHEAYGSPEPRLNSSRAAGCRLVCNGSGRGGAMQLLGSVDSGRGLCSIRQVLPKLSNWRSSLEALRPHRRHPRSESHGRFLDSCSSHSRNFRCLAKSNVVSELEGKETDPSIEQSAVATVDAAEHILEQADL
jgi:hypothetical protein